MFYKLRKEHLIIFPIIRLRLDKVYKDKRTKTNPPVGHNTFFPPFFFSPSEEPRGWERRDQTGETHEPRLCGIPQGERKDKHREHAGRFSSPLSAGVCFLHQRRSRCRRASSPCFARRRDGSKRLSNRRPLPHRQQQRNSQRLCSSLLSRSEADGYD